MFKSERISSLTKNQSWKTYKQVLQTLIMLYISKVEKTTEKQQLSSYLADLLERYHLLITPHIQAISSWVDLQRLGESLIKLDLTFTIQHQCTEKTCLQDSAKYSKTLEKQMMLRTLHLCFTMLLLLLARHTKNWHTKERSSKVKMLLNIHSVWRL